MADTGIRIRRYPVDGGRVLFCKEVGNYVMPANSDEVRLWEENQRLRGAIAAALAVFDERGLSDALDAIHLLRDALESPTGESR